MAEKIKLTESLVSEDDSDDMLWILEKEEIAVNQWEDVLGDNLLYVRRLDFKMASNTIPDSNMIGTGRSVAIPRK